MNCPKCHHENPEDSTFCGKCAARLGKEARISLTKTIETSEEELTKGARLSGRYQIIEELGQGGMGKVYRAEDTSLSRPVAIKILPEEFASDPERLARFEREAKLLAILNHPNIASIHGIEESKGRRFLILELAEGETLRNRLERGPLPADEALETCRQIAEGLEAAHEKGIIHRDLKPGNIMISPEGKIKILDFGLAKVYPGEPSVVDIEKSPTITAQMTKPGVVMGTAAYMSPEQARSRAVDKRTDVWSFGCVFYECLTGKRAFEGETVSDTMALILKGEPDWTALPESTSSIIKVLLGRCLHKDPRNRLHDIADARIEIEEVASGRPVSEPGAIRKPTRAWVWGALIGGLVVGAFGTAFITQYFRPAPNLSVIRSTLKIGQDIQLAGENSGHRPTRKSMAISSDGSFIIYCGFPENPSPGEGIRIYLRRMNEMDATPVEGTEGAIGPFLSPDDKWIGFWASGKLKKVPIGGGVPTTICDCSGSYGADWGPDNTIVFSLGGTLRRVGDVGGDVEVLTTADRTRGEYAHRLPRFLPGGRAVMFTIMGNQWDIQPRLAVLDLESGEWHEAMENAADGLYVSTGHLIFLRQGILMAVGFDLDQMKILGQPVPVIANIMQALNASGGGFYTSAGQYCVSNSGWLAYVPGGIFPNLDRSLVRVDQEGNFQPVVDFKAPFGYQRFSPVDERVIAYTTFGTKRKLWIYDLSRATPSPLTEDGIPLSFVWMPDGKSLVLGWLKSGVPNLYSLPVDGSSPMERLTTSENSQYPGSLSPDGKILAFVESHQEAGYDILLLDMESREVTPFLNSKASEGWPEISPDGRWMAYVSNESGQYAVWVRPFPGPGGRKRISNEGGNRPIWSKDGRKLFYRESDRVWVVDIRTDNGFSPGNPHLVFEKRGFGWTTPNRSWDLWPDGQGFLMMTRAEYELQPVTEMILVQNWFEELKRLAPLKK